MGKGHTATTTQRRFTYASLLLLLMLLAPALGWGQPQSQTYTSSSTFTVPAGVTSVTVQCWGGGGRGGSAIESWKAHSGGGGGGGAFAQKVVSVIPGTTYTVTVGAGGNSDSNLNGGDTWFVNNTTVLAKGGRGVVTNNTIGGQGGLSSQCIGDIGGKFNGGNGGTSSNANYGGGGGSSAGSSTNGNNGNNETAGSAPIGAGAGGNGSTSNGIGGLAGSPPGGGGGGATKGTGSAVPAGGSGGNGKVVISWVAPELTISATTLDFGFTANGSTSASQSFTLSGINLTGAPSNVTINAPANFEVSLSTGSGYASSINVPYASATLSAIAIYVRFKPTTANTNYSGNVTINGGGSATQNIVVTGNSILNYCTAGATTCDEYIKRVTVGSIDNITAQTTVSYNDYTGISSDVIIGNSYPINVVNGNVYSGDQCGIWVDWNQDGVFNDTDEFISTTGTYSANIIPPSFAAIGPTRMRIRVMYSGILSACNNVQYGEVEDYTLNVIPAAITYYSRGSDPTQLSNWSTTMTGAIIPPVSFTANNQFFVLQNNMTANAAWTVSGTGTKVQVQNGAALTANAPITLSASTTFQLDAGATYNHNVASDAIWSGTEVIDAASTVVYGASGVQNVAVPTLGSYGNLTIAGGDTKTMMGGISINGMLNLNNGNISLGSGVNDLTLGSSASITGTFDSNHMVICDGSGRLVKKGDIDLDFIMVYPVGTGSGTGKVYTPYEITSLTATGTGSVAVRVVASKAPGAPAANDTDLKKYWDVTTNSLAAINAEIKMTYDNSEVGVGGDQTSYIPWYYNSSAWSIPTTASGPGANPMVVTGATSLTGQWTAREQPKHTTYYSYQSGSWNTPTTWTTDPSGTLSVAPSVPTANDRVVILNGRTVTATANNYNVLSVQVNEGGTLDLGNFTTQSFTVVRGQGLVRLSNSAFPTADWSNFVSAGGGTVEYYNSADFKFGHLTYNNLILNLSASTNVATLVGNMTVNGNLTVTRGKLQVNDATAAVRNLTVMGNVYVSASGIMGIGAGNANHDIVVKGNFTNDGVVRFTNQTNPQYTTTPTSGRSNVVFNNATADQSLLCNGQSDFYRIVIDKGFDQAYVLNIDASDNTKFKLFGENDYQTSPPSPDVPNAPNDNALGLLAGTVRLGPNIIIPSLSESHRYYIDEDAQLWLDGASVRQSINASTLSLTIYGKLKLTNNAQLDCSNIAQGIVLREKSVLELQSGIITTPCVRPSSISGTHRGAIDISGGTITITGLTSASLNDFASFTLPYPDNVFRMSGGAINIQAPTSVTGGNGTSFSLLIGANANNATITGGAINITIPTNSNAYINTTVPLWNLNFISTSSTYRGQIQRYAGNTSPSIPVVEAQPLVVYNDLNVQNIAVFNANGSNVTVGHNFTIDTGAEYETGDNTTTFNGVGGQRFTNAGAIYNGNGLYNLTVTKKSNLDIFSNDLIVRNNLAIDASCFLNDVGHSIRVNRNVANSGTHTSQASGAILLKGTANQTIGGSGQGVFGNLNLSNALGATITANQSVTGNLRLDSGILDIGSFNLKLGGGSNVYDALTGTAVVGLGTTKMIRLAGLQSDGGVTKSYGSTADFRFPIGVVAGYTPASIQVTQVPTIWGDITVRIASEQQPFATSANSLKRYWKVTSSGITGLQSKSITHSYVYLGGDVTGTVASYIPAAYRPFSWVPINDPGKVFEATKVVQFSGIDSIDGDYTAGETNAFTGVKVFYSQQNGDWNKPETWSNEKVGGVAVVGPSSGDPVVGVHIPGPDNPVVIGDATQNHTVTVPSTYSDKITTGGLQISSGSTLDLTTTTGHNFGAIPDTKVLGTGTLRISSSGATAVFPGGDFGNFLSSGGGTVEYYSTSTLGSSFTLPTTYVSAGTTVNITTYNNLNTSPAAGKTITLPNTDLMVYNTYSIGGTGISQLNSNAVLKTLTVGTKLEVLGGGTLRYPNGGAQSVVANGDILVNSGGVFDVSTSGTATNLLSVQGNLTNNGTFDMNTGGTSVCNVTFTGDSDKEINGTGATTDFNTITVNKGSSRNTLLEVKSSALSLNTSLPTALTLTSGTFRLTSPITLGLTNSGNFTIPISGCLSANGGTINIGGSAATDATDLKLDGRLEVLAGAISIGTPGDNLNNDIEYSSGGTPEITVGGTGKLFVNGQIRRVTTINTGSLSYTQSGSSEVTIAGRNANSSRSMLEVLNAGSKFKTSGTSKLTFQRSFIIKNAPDLYLAPDSTDVKGGAVIFGVASTLVDGFTFNMVTSVPLWNVEVDGTTNVTEANLRIYPLVLKGDLKVRGGSSFKANGLDVSIAGSFLNGNGNAGSAITTGGYQAGALTQTTTFNGSNQTIEGAGSNLTNFANLVIAPTGTLTLNVNSNIWVNGNLTLNSGTLDDGGNTITQIGNVYNQAAHISSTTKGGISFEGSQQQVISGNGAGVFGHVTVKNSLGLIVKDNLQVNGVLNFDTGSIYLDDYLLTFGKDATVDGTTDANRMIILNGVISDAGVKKVFNSGASSFTYPLGVAGKYTPATYAFASNGNSAGELTVKPVNYKHPAALAPEDDQLKYYWNVVAKNFSSAYSVTQAYSYKASDVLGDEAQYKVGRYLSGAWMPEDGVATGAAVNGASHTINLTNVSYLDGEYTAGLKENFKNKKTLYSRTSDVNWFATDTWSETAGGSSCGYIPNGNPVVISAGHKVTLASNGANAYSVDIRGTLDVGLTVYHNIGHVIGNGKLVLTSTADGIFVFPGGEFDVFAATAGSTIEFKGETEATLPLKPGNNYKPYQNVIFSGAGKKMITAEDLKVLGNLTINAGATLSNELFNRTITSIGNWTDNNVSATGGFIPGKGLVNFNGTNAQTLTVANGTTIEQFYNLKIDNAAGLTIAGAGKAAVSNLLYLTKGNITTNIVNLLSITNTSASAVVGGSSASFVNGPLQKKMNAGGSFAFPVGDAVGNRFGKVVLSEVSTSGNYLSQYFKHNPLADGYDPDKKTAPVDKVSYIEYWKVNGPGGSTGNVTLRWDEASVIIPPSAGSRQKLRVVEWVPLSWVSKGNIVTDGGVTSGTIKTSPATSLAGDHIMTIGVESLPTATITGGTASICNDGSTATIPITLTGTGPWNIKYKINGANETSISNIATSPYSLVVSNAIPALASGGPKNYIFTISYVQDNTGSTGISDFTTSATITLNESPNPVITGLTTTPQNSTVTYQTPLVAGHTYSWLVVSNGAIQGSATGNQVSVKWGTAATGTLRLTETVTLGGCSKTPADYVVAITDIPAPVVTGNSTVCNGSVNTYSTPLVGSHTYSWTVVGGTPVSGTSNTITVTWATPGAGSVKVAETSSTPSTVSNTLNVTINPLPSKDNVVSDPTICSGTAASIVVTGAAAGIEYQLRLNSDNSNVGTAISSGPGGDTSLPFTAGAAGAVSFNVWAVNEYGCGVMLTDLSNVSVKANPSFTLAVDNTNTCAGDKVVLTVTSVDAATYTWPPLDGEVASVSDLPTPDPKKKQINWKPNSGLTFSGFPPQIAKTLSVLGTLNGCSVTNTVNVVINRKPETGPPYHVGNNVSK